MVQKLRQKFKTCMESKKSNKGFTLVELIVVIVILAILIGVTIGGVFGYVNKSRINTDINNAAAIQSACSTLAVDSTIASNKSKTFELSWSKSTDAHTFSNDFKKNASDTKNYIESKFDSLLTDGLPTSKSGATFKLEIKTDANGNVTVKCRAYDSDGSELQAQE